MKHELGNNFLMPDTIHVNLTRNNQDEHFTNFGLNPNRRGKIRNSNLEALKPGLEKEEMERNINFKRCDPEVLEASRI